MSEIYDKFTREATQSIEKWLMHFSEHQKTGKEYNDFLVNFLKWSTLTVTNHCDFSDEKKKNTLVDILSPLPIIDDELFNFLWNLRDKYKSTKPIGWTHIDYSERTKGIKEKISQPIKEFVKKRTDLTIDQYREYCNSIIQPTILETNNINKQINEYELQLDNIKNYNIDMDDIPSEDTIDELKETIDYLKERKEILEIQYNEIDTDIWDMQEKFMKDYPKKIQKFNEKITHLAEEYIFAKKKDWINNPLRKLKNAYIKLFLLDELDSIQFSQWSEYNFELWKNTLQEINNKKQELTNILTKENKNWQLDIFSEAS